MGLINGEVTLENNYGLWKKMFEEEKERLKEIFKDNSIQIEHVGSTAVKGLLAKPIVDIAVGVNSFDRLDKNTLSNFYTIKENLDENEILLIKENETETFYLIHVLPINDKRFNDMIKFRDILISNPNVLKKYEDLKLKLSKQYSNDRKMYTRLKSEYIQNVLGGNEWKN